MSTQSQNPPALDAALSHFAEILESPRILGNLTGAAFEIALHRLAPRTTAYMRRPIGVPPSLHETAIKCLKALEELGNPDVRVIEVTANNGMLQVSLAKPIPDALRTIGFWRAYSRNQPRRTL